MGNKLADEQAKQTMAGNSSPTNRLPVLLQKALPPNPAALQQEHYKSLRRCWKSLWKTSPHFPRLQAYNVLLLAAYLSLLQKLQITWGQTSLLFQL